MTVTLNSQQLIEGCQGLVKSLAMKIHRQIHESVDLDDLIGEGQLGLAQAAQDFDSARGVKFSTFAYYRIRGAIYDGLAKTARSRRLRIDNEIQYNQLADQILQEQPPPRDASGGGETRGGETVPGTIQSAARWLSDLTGKLAVVYLMSYGGDQDSQGVLELADPSAPSPAAVAAEREVAEKLREFITRLPAELADLVSAVYYEGLTLQQAGERIGVSKSWASRLHNRALEMLGASLRSVGAAD